MAPSPITRRDQELLEYLACHRMVSTEHVRVWFGVSAAAARARLRRLSQARLADGAVRFHGQSACWRITRRGLAAIGSRLPAPRDDLSAHTHDLGVAWLWLAARDGAFGALREAISERELRSRDGPGERTEALAVHIAGTGPRGGERRHYPDLLLTTRAGARVAVELELTGKSRARREQILLAYGADRSIDHVLYLVRDRRVGDDIAASARRLGLDDLVRVQRVRLDDPTRPRDLGRSAEWRRGVER